jgi:DNA-directed RNA polymerase specialized sigma subunit
MLTNVSEFEVEDTIIVSMTKILTIGINSYQPSEASFRTFALRIAQNNALDTIRKNKKSIFTAIDDTMQVSDNLVSAEQITSFDVKEKSIDLSILTERQKKCNYPSSGRGFLQRDCRTIKHHNGGR